MDNLYTMLKIRVKGDYLSLSTYSRDYRSPGDFRLHENKLIDLEQRRYAIGRDGTSYLALWRYPGPDGKELLQLSFSWLKRERNGRLSGKEVEFTVPYHGFKDTLRKSWEHPGEYQNILSRTEHGKIRIEFRCHRNLKDAVSNPHIRRKLGHFLGKLLLWPGKRTICFYNDMEPYSFGFSEENVSGYRVYGAMILHGKENPKKAYYSIHT